MKIFVEETEGNLVTSVGMWRKWRCQVRTEYITDTSKHVCHEFRDIWKEQQTKYGRSIQWKKHHFRRLLPAISSVRRIRRMRFPFIKRTSLTVSHNNTRATLQKKTNNKIKPVGKNILLHPRYSPNLKTTRFNLLWWTEFFGRRRTFNIRELEKKSFKYFVEKITNFFKGGIKSLPSIWAGHEKIEGDYILTNNI